MHETEQRDEAADRGGDGEGHREARHAGSFGVAGQLSQHDHAVEERGHENAEHALVEAVAKEVTQDSGAELVGGEREHDHCHGKGDRREGDHRAGECAQQLACAGGVAGVDRPRQGLAGFLVPQVDLQGDLGEAERADGEQHGHDPLAAAQALGPVDQAGFQITRRVGRGTQSESLRCGRSTQNEAPPSAGESQLMSPPILSTRPFEMLSPRPVLDSPPVGRALRRV